MQTQFLHNLADELEHEHGSYPHSRADLEFWIMSEMAMLSGAGVSDQAAQRAWLHDRYPQWLLELDAGIEEEDEAYWLDREQSEIDQDRESLDVADVDFTPPKAKIELRVPEDFDKMGADEIIELFEGNDDQKGG